MNSSRSVPRLAEKLDWLMANIRDLDGSRATPRRISEWLEERGVACSASHIGNLRTGYRTNPDWRVLDGIADYFGVPPRYWIDELVEAAVRADVADLSNQANRLRGDLTDRVGRLTPSDLDRVSQLLQSLEREQRHGGN